MSEPSFTPPDLDTLNEWLPVFNFISRLAADESKAVYLVKQKSLDRKAAIKIYAPELSASPDFRKDFAATTGLMARLKHPNLIGVYDSGVCHDLLYSVSEFVAGKPLWNSTRGESIHIKHVRGLMEGITEGVCHAHQNDIHHGALSLANILIDETHTPKIGGFSQATGDTSKLDPSALRFRAPELGEQGAKPKVQSDIYSMGVILREMAIGQTEPEEELAKIPKHGPALRKLVAKATSADPSKRHRSAEDFKEELLAAFGEGSPNNRLTAGGKKLAAGGPAGAGRAAGVPGRPPGKPGPVQPVKASSPAKLWLHLIIIVVLLFAIRIAWKAYKDKEERNRTIEEAQSTPSAGRKHNVIRTSPPLGRHRAENNHRWSNAERPETDDFPNDPSPGPVNVAPKRDIKKELARLRFDLSRGSRQQMPEGTLRKGDQYYLHVDVPMTWHEAFWFAMDHGGHLAVPSRGASVEWIGDEVASDADEAIWVGAAKSGRYSWTLSTGRPWRPNNPSVSLGDYAAIGEGGVLEAKKETDELEFVIQWNADGSNPGSLESLFKITKDSLDSSSPVYPPGTRSFGVRRYLYVPQPITWKKAVLSARSSGGHLAVVTGVAETFNIEKLTKELDAENGLWMGGFHLAGKGWRWTTGEPWRSSEWPNDKAAATADAALLVQPGGEWGQRSRETEASGYLIEWSEDSKKAR